MNINGNHAIAASNLVFMNVSVDDLTKIVSIVLALGYFCMALREHILKWKEKKSAAKQREEQKSSR